MRLEKEGERIKPRDGRKPDSQKLGDFNKKDMTATKREQRRQKETEKRNRRDYVVD